MSAALVFVIAAATSSPVGLREECAWHGPPAWLTGGCYGAHAGPSGLSVTDDPSEGGSRDGQPAAPGAAASPPLPRFQLDGGFERRRDRFRYRFENPSAFNTRELVDHVFQQRYDADNSWVVVRAAYRSSPGRRWSAEVGLTPQITTFGEDLDTFFNPGNNVIVSGTSGKVSMRSTRAAGWLERTRRNGLIERLGYSYRRDRSKFRTPERRIVTMSNPPSVEETITFDHETTISEVHQWWVGVATSGALAPRWRIIGGVDVAPAVLARLNTLLPEKYPGQDIVFWATGFELAGRAAIVRDGRWPIEASVDLGRTFSYRSSARFIRDSFGVSMTVGFARSPQSNASR